MTLNLNDIFKSTNLKGIISIDDTWNYNTNAEACLWDIYNLSEYDRQFLLSEIKDYYVDIAQIVSEAIDELSRIGFDCTEGAKGQIFIYLKDAKSLDALKKFTNEHVEKILDIIQKYGVGLQISGIPSLTEILQASRDESIPIRIYTDFTSDDQTHFVESIKQLSGDDGYVFCIIDDQLGGESRAAEIIKVISETSEIKNKVSSVLLTSGDTEDKQIYNGDIHIEFIKKETSGANNNIGEKISAAYIKSLYRIMLSKLQNAKQDAINSVFDSLYGEVDTALYISKMAEQEGCVNFDMINKWIQTKELLELEEKRILDIKSIIILSNALNNISPNEKPVGSDYINENDLYSIDAYDTSVNQLHKAIDVGDVFEVNGEYYVLIGQECDLSIRSDGKRNTEVLEFVKATIFDSVSDIIKNDFKIESAIIGKFPIDNSNFKYISIACSKRYYGKTDIFDMCSYNDDGSSQICINEPLDCNIRALLPKGLNLLYDLIQQKYLNYNCVKKQLDKEQFAVFVKNISLTNEKNHVISYESFNMSEDSVVSYNVKRICRLRKHANLLHKMYLNYRGRQAEEAVCFSRYANIKYQLGKFNFEALCLLSSKEGNNKPKNLHKRCWMVKTKDINEYLKDVGKTVIQEEREYIELQGTSNKLYELTFNKKYNADECCSYIEIS